jgi:hypothetical protein
VAFQSKDIKQHILQDASILTKQNRSINKNLKTAQKLDIQDQIQHFLNTPEGQQYKAQASIQLASMYLEKIIESLKNPNLNLQQKMLLNLAMLDCLHQLQKNEKIMNLMKQSNDSEIS